MTSKIIILLMLCVPFSAFSATYYDCIQSDGQKSYRVEPCPKGDEEVRHFEVDTENLDQGKSASKEGTAPTIFKVRVNAYHEIASIQKKQSCGHPECELVALQLVMKLKPTSFLQNEIQPETEYLIIVLDGHIYSSNFEVISEPVQRQTAGDQMAQAASTAQPAPTIFKVRVNDHHEIASIQKKQSCGNALRDLVALQLLMNELKELKPTSLLQNGIQPETEYLITVLDGHISSSLLGVVSEPVQPQTSGEQIAQVASTAQNESAKDGFPVNYISINPQTHTLMPWRRTHLTGGPWGNNPDPALRLINITEGSVVIYTAPGPQMKPGTELKPPADFQSILSRLNEITPPGQPGTGSAYFALLLKKNDKYTLLPLNYSESDTAHILTTYAINENLLTSSYDPAQGRYLLFAKKLAFKSASWDETLPSWEHFDAWWLDAKNEKIEHIVLPTGPWVSDAKLDKMLFRDARNFSCGVECYRNYHIKVESGDIFVSISGRPSAIHESVTGIFKLSKGSTRWEKIKND